MTSIRSAFQQFWKLHILLHFVGKDIVEQLRYMLHLGYDNHDLTTIVWRDRITKGSQLRFFKIYGLVYIFHDCWEVLLNMLLKQLGKLVGESLRASEAD